MPKSVEMANLVHGWRQHLHLYQDRFAAKLGVADKMGNWWQLGHTLEKARLGRSLDEPEKASLKHYFSGEELNV
ncbi:hypothetical protein [Nostoc sp. MS1]|uniref:hypothetical protein n=1 Tax=Nostoc sp. MS1 TaxID=2764711 RepID=UPI001CC7328A|nr:hypothetical protein [Nostoc sp. MS1]